MLEEMLDRARRAARALAKMNADARDAAIEGMARAIDADRAAILSANADDVAAATTISDALKDRLVLTDRRVDAMIRALFEVRQLPDPLGSVRELGPGRAGLRVTRRRVPLGVIAIVYEARPNVTAECAALTIKSGNAVILRGGKEAKASNEAIARAVRRGLWNAGVDENAVIGMFDSSREEVEMLLSAVGKVDLVIPRGGKSLMEMVDRAARVPVIRHGEGICHVYVHSDADASMAQRIAFNAKVQRPGVCNAMETLLVHRSRLSDVLRPLAKQLIDAGVDVRADETAREALSGLPIAAATDQDWDTEFLALTLAVRTVDDLDAAIDHIAQHGTHHTASIVTKDRNAAERFLAEVDASCVLWNASTRFNDGGELGLGAEMGISTSKMHAYGPMSVQELTAEKLVVYGDGQIRE
jgi:glutamate-5-semialdehyde dehydrogenase